MEFKGTKGEWKVGVDFEKDHTKIFIQGDSSICATNSNSEIDYNNARLISAAPDLLKALQFILDFPKEDLDGWRKEGNTQITLNAYHINKGLEAIEKALD